MDRLDVAPGDAEGGAEATDLNVKRPNVRSEYVTPDVYQKPFPGEDAIPLGCQVPQQVERASGQAHGVPLRGPSAL